MRARTSCRHVAAAFVGVGLGVIAAASPAIAAERAYELVTPPGSSARALPGTGASTPDGNVVCFDAENTAAESQVNGEMAPDGFCSSRTSAGWQTRWVTGPTVANPVGTKGASVFFVAPDGSRVAFATDKGFAPDYQGGTSEADLATLSTFLWEGGDMPRWLTPTREPTREDFPHSRLPLAASEDLGHGVFQSMLPLLPEDGNDLVDVYEWTPAGIRLVSRDASGAAVGGSVPRKTDEMVADDLDVAALPGAISRDGSRIFFQHAGGQLGGPAVVSSVYMRDGDGLRHVSPRRGGDVPRHVWFAGASDDGGTVFLQSAERLTPEPKEAGSALYRYDIASDDLSLVATDPLGVVFLGLSSDGSTVVFRTGDPEGWIPGELRVVRDGVTRTLGALDGMDTMSSNSVGSLVFGRRALRIAADGSAFVFSSIAPFDGTEPGSTQVYRWTPTEGVRRISAITDGRAPAGGADIGNWSVSFGLGPRAVGLVNSIRNNQLLGRVLADDGRIFFETSEQLVPRDVNEYIDVYEWQDGVVRLITPGTQGAHAVYHDNSADGNTLFFTTSARLIPELDRNTALDLYAARVGGGFPLPPSAPACEGDRCQGPPATPPVSQAPGTTVFHGPGDAADAPPPIARHSVLRITARQRRAFARRGRIVLQVRASANGVVTATARARIRRRTVRVARANAVARSGRIVRVPLSLSRQARAVLRDGRRLRVTVSVAYSESDTTVRRVVVLRG